MKTTGVLESLTHEMSALAELEPPTGMWDRFAARLDAESPARAGQPVRKQVFVRGLALVPTR